MNIQNTRIIILKNDFPHDLGFHEIHTCIHTYVYIKAFIHFMLSLLSLTAGRRCNDVKFE